MLAPVPGAGGGVANKTGSGRKMCDRLFLESVSPAGSSHRNTDEVETTNREDSGNKVEVLANPTQGDAVVSVGPHEDIMDSETFGSKQRKNGEFF